MACYPMELAATRVTADASPKNQPRVHVGLLRTLHEVRFALLAGPLFKDASAIHASGQNLAKPLIAHQALMKHG